MARKRGRGKKNKTQIKTLPKNSNLSPITPISLSTRVHPAVSDPYPLNKLCRLCLLSNTNMEPIFAYPGDRTLANKIYQCTNLEIKENTGHGIPTTICGQCKQQLEQCHEFRLVCWKNNEVLHNLHALLSPRSIIQQNTRTNLHAYSPATPNPVVQVKKLNLNTEPSPRSYRSRGSISGKTFSIHDLPQFATPRSNKKAKNERYPLFSKELVVCLSPLSKDVLNKLKKTKPTKLVQQKKSSKQVQQTKPTKPVQQTKAAVKSFPIPVKRGRPAGAKREKPKIKKEKVVKKTEFKKRVQAKVLKVKKPKAKEIAVPPKKRKENYPVAVSLSVSCTLCSQKFNSEKGLQRHIASHNKNRKLNNVFNCNICKREYLKPTQLTDHMASPEHIQNTTIAPDEGEVSILPDEEEDPGMSILPDDEPVTQPILNRGLGAVEHDQNQSAEYLTVTPPVYPETVTPEPPNVPEELYGNHPSPDTNEVSQPPESEPIPEEEPIEETANSESASGNIRDRDASPIPVDSESSRSREGGVQYSDVCSTNNAETLVVENGNGTDDGSTVPSEPCNNSSTRRVTFSDVAEIVE
ncbi:uncharacterized protein LOC129751390 [Uranotaenia lowii]|uniref:uncharacterized protein LOC129751390 n=1 Tax=Uranotaenia lowii TaxID=190385 RepID=UPI002478D476|nr:uncharacterized protein LOC129751390 [Uranotaenia lowii]